MDWRAFTHAAGPDGVFRGFPPPAPPTPEQRRAREQPAARAASAEAAVAVAVARGQQSRREQEERSWWGGHAPSPDVRAAGDAALSLARRDYAVAETLVRLDEQTQRRIMLWAVHQAVDATDEHYRLLLAPAVAALDRGEPLPAPFDSSRTAWAALLTGAPARPAQDAPTYAVRAVRIDRANPRPAPVAPYAAAMAAVLAAAADQRTTVATIAAVDAAASAVDSSHFFDLLRETFDLPQ